VASIRLETNVGIDLDGAHSYIRQSTKSGSSRDTGSHRGHGARSPDSSDLENGRLSTISRICRFQLRLDRRR